MTPYKGSETWILAGYVGSVPQYRTLPGGPVLPRKGATANAAQRGYRATFRDTVAAPRARADTGTAMDWGTVGDVVWYGFIFGIAWGGC